MSLFDAATEQDWIARAERHIADGTTDMADAVIEYDVSFYTDPTLMDREFKAIFDCHPVIAAHGSQIPQPLDFVTVQLSRTNVLICRTRTGEVNAFANVCRHRGAKVEWEACGNKGVFSCPYHGWTYGMDGALRGVSYPDKFGPVEKPDLGLVPLPVEERHGFIWVIEKAGVPIDIAAYLGEEMDEILAHYGVADRCVERSEELEIAQSWKVAQDGFVDSYHLRFLHPQTVAGLFHTDISVFQTLGDHARWAVPRKNFTETRADPDKAFVFEKHFIAGNYLAPNSVLTIQPSHFELLTFTPHATDPRRSRMRITYLVPQEKAGPEFKELWDKNWQVLMSAVLHEDLPAGDTVQEGSQSNMVGRYVLGRNEIANQHFHAQYWRMLNAAGV